MSVDEIERLAELPSTYEMARPIKIKVMATMNGIVYGVKCRCCHMYFAYMADLELSFESAQRHIERHLYEQEVVENPEVTC